MPVTQTQMLPAPYIQDVGQDYAKQLTGLTGIALDPGRYAPSVAAQDPLQEQAATLAGQGVGAYQPYVTGAQQAMGYDPAAGGVTAAGYQAALQPYETPYQADVLQATLDQFDVQKAQREQEIRAKATEFGSLGAGRTGVQLGQYQAQSDLDRALLGAGIRQQGFTQAQTAAGRGYQQQTGLAQLLPQLQQGDISQLGRVGAQQQAQTQAVLGAQQEANRMQAFEPYERLGYYGQGIGSLQGTGGQYGFTAQPNPSPLAQALGTASVLGGLFGNYTPAKGAMDAVRSDTRLKTDIELTGQSPAGVNIYSFKYKGDDKTYQGVMAQEVPWASLKGNDGYYLVDYSKVDVEFKRLH